MIWKIEFDPEARKDFKTLGTAAQRDVISYLQRLAEMANPRLRGKPLRGNKFGLWRYRVDKYRILCKLEDHRLVIFVIRVGKRDKVYD